MALIVLASPALGLELGLALGLELGPGELVGVGSFHAVSPEALRVINRGQRGQGQGQCQDTEKIYQRW